MRRGLRWRLVLTHSAVALIAVAMLATVTFIAGNRRFDSYLNEVRNVRNESLVQTLEQTYKPPDGWDAVAIYALSQVAVASNVDVAVYSAEGKLLFTLEGRQEGQGVTEAQGDPAGAASGSNGSVASATAVGSDLVIRTYPVTVAGETVATAEIYASQGLQDATEEAYLGDLARNLVIVVLIALGLAFVVSLLVSRRVTRPLEELADAADDVARGNLDVRVAPRSGDEVGALAVAFNTMAGRLAQDEQWRRDMTADLSHALRAPLAAIQSHIAALESGSLPATRENLRLIAAETERLGGLLGALRTLNELESEDLAIEYEELELSDIARDVIAALQPSYAAHGVTLIADLNPVRVRADRQRLMQIVDRLLDNALKYTPPGGRVVLAAIRGDGPPERHPDTVPWAHLSVSDNGPGIDPGDLPFVFDRFYRGKSARGSQGVGLGLAIVRGLVEAQGGVVWVGNNPAGGTMFTVYLPLAN